MSGLRSIPRQSPSSLRRRTAAPINQFSSQVQSRQDQTFTLPDGRTLGFAEYGVPTGKPVLYFHGYPSSRIEAGAVDAIAQRLGLRLLALDRPGFGLSSPAPQSKITDWPTDVQSFASGMNIPKFAVVGLSGGGPFALACARVLPQEMLTGVGAFATAPHWAAGRHYMSYSRRVLSWMAFYVPLVLKLTLNVCLRVLNWATSTSFVTTRIDKWLSQQKSEDQENAEPKRTIPERRENLMRILYREAFVQGTDPTIHETRLLSANDWGFRLEDVTYDKVHIWHGVEDTNAPITMIRWMAEKLPHCELHELPGDTHYTMFKHIEPALAQLVPQDP